MQGPCLRISYYYPILRSGLHTPRQGELASNDKLDLAKKIKHFDGAVAGVGDNHMAVVGDGDIKWVSNVLGCFPLLSELMSASSPGIKDLDPPLAVMYHHYPSRLGTQRQPSGVNQGSPASEGVVAGEGPGAAGGGTVGCRGRAKCGTQKFQEVQHWQAVAGVAAPAGSPAEGALEGQRSWVRQGSHAGQADHMAAGQVARAPLLAVAEPLKAHLALEQAGFRLTHELPKLQPAA